MPKSPGKIRLFVAAYPDEAIAGLMLGAIDDLALPDGRPVPLEQVHLTIHFVGSVKRGELEPIRESIRHALRGIQPLEVGPERLVALPRSESAKLVALEGTASHSLRELRRRLVSRLADTSRNPGRGKGDFLPHFTLYRFTRPAAVELSPDLDIDLPVLWFGEIRLMESKLTHRGAIHRELESFSIPE